MIKSISLGLTALCCSVLAVQASINAADEADNSPYGGAHGWQSGDNGGSGFGSWVLTATSGDSSQNGFFIGSSAANAGGSSGNIDTSGVSFAMYANNGQTASAVRPLTGGSLLAGQTIDLKIDNGFIQNGGTEGFGLQTSGGQNRLEFFFTGGNGSYTLVDNSGANPTGIPFTGDGLSISFALQSADTYLMTVTPNGGPTSAFSGTLEGTSGSGIDQLRFFDFNGGSGDNFNFYANQLAVVPEPSTVAAGVLAIIGAFFIRHRRAAA